MDIIPQWHVFAAAFFLDLILGDPAFLPHPVRIMGSAISFFEKKFRKLPIKLRFSGGLFALFLILCTWGLTFLIITIALSSAPVVKTVIETVLIYYCLSARSLYTAAKKVAIPLACGKTEIARSNLAMIVGRDVNSLSKSGIVRAAIETVAENLVDGFISPLFYAAIGGAPLAITYKMVNTLDSMVGYKNPKYINFGKTAAKIDDAANFIPARLSAVVISLAAKLISGNGLFVFKTAISQGKNHSSPNAGFPEAAFAGALKIWLGGPGYYHKTLVIKPYIGKNFNNAAIKDIDKACQLMLFSSAIWVVIICCFIFLKHLL